MSHWGFGMYSLPGGGSTKRKRKSKSINGIMKRKNVKIVKDGAMAAAGLAAGQLLTNNVAFLSTNPVLSAVAKIAGGVFIAGMGKSTQAIGIGMAASGALDGLKQVAPGALDSGVGALPYGTASTAYIPGVSGYGTGSDDYMDTQVNVV